MTIIQFELYRMVRKKSLYVSIAIGIMIALCTCMVELHEVMKTREVINMYGAERLGLYYPRSFYNSFIGLEYAYLPSAILYTVLPLLCAFPYAVSLYDDLRSGYAKQVLVVQKRKQYTIAKCISVFMSGALVVLATLLASALLTLAFFPLLKPEQAASTFSPNSETQMWATLFLAKPELYTLSYALVDIILYGVLNMICIPVSFFAGNRLTVAAMPELLYMLVHLLCRQMGLLSLSPMAFLRPCQIFVEAKGSIIAAEMAAILGIVFLSCLLSGRKMNVL